MILPAGNHDGVSFGQQAQATGRGCDVQTTGRAERAGVAGGDLEAIPLGQLRARQAEHLHGDAEFKGAEAVIGQSDNEGRSSLFSVFRVWHDSDDSWHLCHSQQNFNRAIFEVSRKREETYGRSDRIPTNHFEEER